MADAEHLGVPGGDVVEQGVHRGESLVAGAGVVAAVLFEVSQESDDPIEGEIAELQAGDLAALVGRGEYQQQPDRVAVAAHRGWAQPLDGDQVVDEERVQQLAQWRGGGHRAASRQAGSVKASNRWLASPSNPGVTVR